MMLICDKCGAKTECFEKPVRTVQVGVAMRTSIESGGVGDDFRMGQWRIELRPHGKK